MTVVPNERPNPANAAQSEGESKWPGQMADDIANTYGPEPLASLTATAHELVLSGTRGTFRIPRSAVTQIGRGNLYPWFFSALRIHHSIAGFPKSLQFKPQPGHWRDVVARLKALGYPTT
jgi:hypothetical protein